MNLLVFGASGSIGKQLIVQALEKGYTVSAFCRDKNKLGYPEQAGLHCLEGDVFNLQEVKAAMKNQDAVCIVLGSGSSRKSVVRSTGTKNIIAAMEEAGIMRLVCQTTLGAGNSWGNLNFFWKRIMFGWYLRQVFLDHELQEHYVRESTLHWTLVRPAAFTDGERTGKYRHGFPPDDKSTTLKISRKDVADFILKELETKEYLYKAPGLSY